MRIEKGKYYRTRDGRKVGPVRPATNPDNGPFQADLSDGSNWCYDADGRLTNLRHVDMVEDIVAEWTDEGPVVTETVQRIKPGVYGRLSVAEDTAPYVSIALTSPDGMEVIERYRRSFSAPELRELARVALEIAEYLENA